MMKNLEISPELQIQINRQLWIQALRTEGSRQCHGVKDKHFVCAINLAPEFIVMLGSVQSSLGMRRSKRTLLLAAQDNDSGWTYAQIATAAEAGRYWD